MYFDTLFFPLFPFPFLIVLGLIWGYRYKERYRREYFQQQLLLWFNMVLKDGSVIEVIFPRVKSTIDDLKGCEVTWIALLNSLYSLPKCRVVTWLEVVFTYLCSSIHLCWSDMWWHGQCKNVIMTFIFSCVSIFTFLPTTRLPTSVSVVTSVLRNALVSWIISVSSNVGRRYIDEHYLVPDLSRCPWSFVSQQICLCLCLQSG